MTSELKTVLIIEKVSTENEILKSILQQKYKIETANGFEQILELLSKDAVFSAILIDFSEVKGKVETSIKKIRNISSLSSTPIFIVSNKNEINKSVDLIETGSTDIIYKPLVQKTVLTKVQRAIRLSEAKATSIGRFATKILSKTDIDFKTGLYNKESFCKYTKEKIDKNSDKNYLIIRWDLDKFKLYNDTKGFIAGDKLLLDIADICRYVAKKDKALITYGHLEADHFITCLAVDDCDANDIIDYIEEKVNKYTDNYNLTARCGIYKVDRSIEDVGLMCDRALIALKSIKNDISKKFAFYDNSMLSNLKDEQKLLSEINEAIENKQFKIFLQPQYNYESGMMIGAEALVRWQHPEKGLIMPNDFIPMFEKNKLMPKLDGYVLKEICTLQRNLIDFGRDPIPVSVNISRQDIYDNKLCSDIISSSAIYNIDPSLIHFEITESAYVEDSEQLTKVIDIFRKEGYTIEIDDFGSGYSSLNTLTNIAVDFIKLDLKFISDCTSSNRNTSILSSIIRMAHWLNLPVIAEGVETFDQAEYLKSLNCIYMQGYYFCKPIPLLEYQQLIISNKINLEKVEKMNNGQTAFEFWKNSDLATLLFNTNTGGSAVFEYYSNNVELIRSNDQYFKEICISREDYLKYENNFLSLIDEPHKQDFINMLKSAISTGNQSSCEVIVNSNDKEIDPIWLSVHAKFLAVSNNYNYLFYITIENVSYQKQLYFDCLSEMEKCNNFIESLDSFLLNDNCENKVELTETIVNSINKSNSIILIIDKTSLELLYYNERAHKEFTCLKDVKYCQELFNEEDSRYEEFFLSLTDNNSGNISSKPKIAVINDKKYILQTSKMSHFEIKTIVISLAEVEDI